MRKSHSLSLILKNFPSVTLYVGLWDLDEPMVFRQNYGMILCNTVLLNWFKHSSAFLWVGVRYSEDETSFPKAYPILESKLLSLELFSLIFLIIFYFSGVAWGRLAQAPSELKNEKTIVIISHRKNALSFCDDIYELKNNQILKLHENIP